MERVDGMRPWSRRGENWDEFAAGVWVKKTSRCQPLAFSESDKMVLLHSSPLREECVPREGGRVGEAVPVRDPV